MYNQDYDVCMYCICLVSSLNVYMMFNVCILSMYILDRYVHVRITVTILSIAITHTHTHTLLYYRVVLFVDEADAFLRKRSKVRTIIYYHIHI